MTRWPSPVISLKAKVRPSRESEGCVAETGRAITCQVRPSVIDVARMLSVPERGDT